MSVFVHRRPRQSPDRIAVAALWAGFIALLATAVAAEPLALEARRIPLNPEFPDVNRVGALDYRGGLVLRSPDPRFGGLSGLGVLADGRLLAVNDRGYWVSFRPVLEHDRLVAVADGDIAAITGGDGRPLEGRMTDAEALIITKNAIFVSFEQDHRVWRYPPAPGHIGAKAKSTMPIPERRALPPNGGFEALTTLGGERLLMVSEEGRNEADDLVGWIVDNDKAYGLSYASTALFKPTDFARLANGDVLALERRFTVIGGFAARLQRIPAATIRPGARLIGREIVRIEPPLAVDNMEGLAVMPAPEGGHMVFIVSDDNFHPLQRTLLMLFHLPD